MFTAPRRHFLKLSGLLAMLPLVRPRTAAAQTEPASDDPFPPLIAAITRGAPLRTGRVKLEVPRLADNGNYVPLRLSVESPMTAADHVESVHLLSEKNPRPVMAVYHFGPQSGRASVSTRVRLGGSQRLMAVARMADGSCWADTAEVSVTISACMDGS
jgi:sulfur-oxidizing protein SoxY